MVAEFKPDAIVTLIVYGLVSFWTKRRWIGLIAAVLYTIHFSFWEVPTRVSASDYAFWAIFYLMTLAMFSLYLERRLRRYYLAAVVFYFVLAFGHDFTLSMPLVLLAYHLTLGRGNKSVREMVRSELKYHVPFWIIWGIHVSIQVYYVIQGTSEAIYSTAGYSPGIHMIGNFNFLISLIIPNIPGYDLVMQHLGSNFEAVVGYATIILTLAFHVVAIYVFWKGTALARFSVAFMYLTFLQYTPWHGAYAGVPRYLYLPSIGFSILITLFLVRLYEWLAKRRVLVAAVVTSTLFMLLVIGNISVVQVWSQYHISSSQFRRTFATQLTADYSNVTADSLIFMGIPDDHLSDVENECWLVLPKVPRCKSFVSGEYSVDDLLSLVGTGKTVYVLKARNDGSFTQIYPTS